MYQNVLITGGSGLLALNWAIAMRDKFKITLGLHKRKIIVKRTYSKYINLDSVSELTKEFANLNCQIVIHTAGLTDVDYCEIEPALARYTNVTLATNVAKACKRLGIQLVHISTDHLFSGEESMATEEYEIAPLNIYGKTKAEAEHIICKIDPNALVIRTNFYGWGTSYRSSFSDFIIDNLRSEKKISLYEDVFYTPILIESLANIVHRLIDLKVSGIFNVVGNNRISKYQFGRKVATQFNFDDRLIIPSQFTKQKGLCRRPIDMSLSNAKVKKYIYNFFDLDVVRQLGKLDQQEKNGCLQEILKM
jgi:dTDP-4-dehydrorhamnose reductase